MIIFGFVKFFKIINLCDNFILVNFSIFNFFFDLFSNLFLFLIVAKNNGSVMFSNVISLKIN